MSKTTSKISRQAPDNDRRPDCPTWCPGGHTAESVKTMGHVYHQAPPVSSLVSRNDLILSSITACEDGGPDEGPWISLGDIEWTVPEVVAVAERFLSVVKRLAAMADGANSATPAPGRPFYLTGPCPAWCRWEHRVQEHPEDRWHYGADGEVELSLMPAELIEEDDYEPRSVRVYLKQHVEHAAPRVTISYNEQPGFDMTISEAAQLRDILADMIREADLANDDGGA